jgi:methylphosphotriester-DNA--protein-cysteine methyltransferase
MEYIALNWQGKFNPRSTAKSLKISVTQLYRLFKHHSGMTPNEFHQKCKVEHLKEKLSERNLTVKEAFSACGEDSTGWVSQVFKSITGLSPIQWREENLPNNCVKQPK